MHSSAVSQLTPGDRRRVKTLAASVPDFDWSVARVGDDSVMLARTTSFDVEDHPELIESVTLRGGVINRKTHNGSRPIYHRCEQMLMPDHPRYSYFEYLSAREQRDGLLSRPDIGTRAAWDRAVKRVRPESLAASILSRMRNR